MSFSQTVIGGGLVVGLSTLVVQSIVPRAELRHLDIALLEYRVIAGRGHVAQQIVSSSGRGVAANWEASIERRDGHGVDTILCKGKGDGIYNGEVSVWSLSDWTGDTCPNLAMPGDFFEVAWIYENHFGLIQDLAARFVLTEAGELRRVLSQN